MRKKTRLELAALLAALAVATSAVAQSGTSPAPPPPGMAANPGMAPNPGIAPNPEMAPNTEMAPNPEMNPREGIAAGSDTPLKPRSPDIGERREPTPIATPEAGGAKVR
jgi:hypothetical protein